MARHSRPTNRREPASPSPIGKATSVPAARNLRRSNWGSLLMVRPCLGAKNGRGHYPGRHTGTGGGGQTGGVQLGKGGGGKPGAWVLSRRGLRLVPAQR